MRIDSNQVTVYWRPYCPYCMRLRRGLRRAGVEFEEVNIWEVPEAAAVVRSHAGGNETVPTVLIGGAPMVNPTTRAVVAEIQRRHPEWTTGPVNNRGSSRFPWWKVVARRREERAA